MPALDIRRGVDPRGGGSGAWSIKEMTDTTVGPSPSQDNGEFKGRFCSLQKYSAGGQRKGKGPAESLRRTSLSYP